MNKKTHIEFNLNNFLMAISFLFDKVESRVYQTKVNHSKRVTFLCLKIGEKFNLDFEEMSDLCSYSLLHNNGLFQANQTIKHNCEISEENIKGLPFLGAKKNILLYQQERYDGSGLYGLKEEEIPLFSQIIAFSSYLDRQFDLTNESKKNKDGIKEFIRTNENKLFSQDLCEIFCDELAHQVSFWLDIQDENTMLQYIYQTLHDFTSVITYEELLEITKNISSNTSKNSKLLRQADRMLDFYSFEHKDKYTFLIAASLMAIGKLSISSESLNKISELNKDEYEQVQSYPYFTQKVLSSIMGFKEISIWAGRIQETLDGKGYPYGLDASSLSFKDRLLSILHIYNALKSEKVYRKKLDHFDAIVILREMGKNGKLDRAIIEDMNSVLIPTVSETHQT